jgi:hypothetical protein
MAQTDEYWGICLDEFSTKIWNIKSDAIGAHYITFEGSRDHVRKQMMEAFDKLIDEELYRATPYGYRWSEETDHAQT